MSKLKKIILTKYFIGVTSTYKDKLGNTFQATLVIPRWL